MVETLEKIMKIINEDDRKTFRIQKKNYLLEIDEDGNENVLQYNKDIEERD
jgi:hypothetical protein